MRTTLSIDEDIARSIESLRSRENLSLREAINRLLRAGVKTMNTVSKSKPYCGPVFAGKLAPGIDPNRMNQLADELEVDQAIS